MDPLGSAFASDLGYTSTGDFVGCNFISGLTAISGRLQCQLIKSEIINAPAKVEIINFNAISAGTTIQFKIAKILNPAAVRATVKLTVKMLHHNPATPAYTMIHEDVFALFLNLQAPSDLALYPVGEVGDCTFSG